jgi:hypothetical protein
LEPFFSALLNCPFFISAITLETNKEETTMGTKKALWVLFGILISSTWVLGSVTLAGAEILKCRNAQTATKDERITIGDGGPVLGLHILEGLAFCENGEMAKVRTHGAFDSMPGKGAQAIGYTTYTFEDGSSFVVKYQRLVTDIGSAKVTSDIINGKGRFEGIKGTASATGKNFPPDKGEAMRSSTDAIFTYTLPSK